MKSDKTFDPVEVGFFCTETPMLETQHGAHLVEQLDFGLHTFSSIASLPSRGRRWDGRNTYLRLLSFGSIRRTPQPRAAAWGSHTACPMRLCPPQPGSAGIVAEWRYSPGAFVVNLCAVFYGEEAECARKARSSMLRHRSLLRAVALDGAEQSNMRRVFQNGATARKTLVNATR
jgi:hypothetical protein